MTDMIHVSQETYVEILRLRAEAQEMIDRTRSVPMTLAQKLALLAAAREKRDLAMSLR